MSYKIKFNFKRVLEKIVFELLDEKGQYMVGWIVNVDNEGQRNEGLVCVFVKF